MDPRFNEYLRQTHHRSLYHADAATRRAASLETMQLLERMQRAGVRPDASMLPGLPGSQEGATAPLHRYGPGPGERPPATPNNTVHLAQLHPPISGDYVIPLTPPSRILTVPDIPAVLPATTSVRVRLDFSAVGGCDNALIIGMAGCSVDNTAGVESAESYEYCTMEVQITFNDVENIVTDGEAASFVPFSHLFTPGDSAAMYPLMRDISSTDIMIFQFRNTQPLATGNTLQPSLSLNIRQRDTHGLGG